MIRFVERLTGAVAALGAVAIAAIMLLTVADVARRTFVGHSITGVVEVAPLLLLAATCLGLGYAEQTRVHVRTSMVTSRLPARAARIYRAFGSLVGVVVLGWVAWEALERAINAVRNADVTPGFVAIPTWPAQVLVPLGFTLFAIHIAIRLGNDITALRSGAPEIGFEDDETLEVTPA